MTQTFQFRGNLKDTSLAEVLQTVYGYRVPGIIRVEREDVVKRIWVGHGAIVRAASTDSVDWLGSMLHREGVISSELFEATMKRRAKSAQRYGEILVAERILSPAEVYSAICRQMESIVSSLFLWDEGAVTFKIGEDTEQKRLMVHLPIPQVVLHGIKRLPKARPLIAALGDQSTIPLPLYELEQLIERGLDADEYRLLRMVDGRLSLRQLCESGPFSAADNARLLYAFTVLKLIGTQPWQERTSEHIEIRVQSAGRTRSG